MTSKPEFKPEAIHTLAMKHLHNGQFVLGKYLLKEADEAGSQIAKCTMGYASLYGIYGFEKDINYALECFLVALSKNNKEVDGSIRAFKELKNLVEPALEMKLDKPDHDFNLPLALNYLIICYEKGWGTEVDVVKAKKLRTIQFEMKNNIRMTFNLGLLFSSPEEKKAQIIEEKKEDSAPRLIPL